MPRQPDALDGRSGHLSGGPRGSAAASLSWRSTTHRRTFGIKNGAMTTLRPAAPGDLPFLHEMLLEAAYPLGPPQPAIDEARADPLIARYIEAWGRAGDAALIAVDEHGRPIGAAWHRVFRPEEPGFGFIDCATPEITIAVVPRHRLHGVGSALLGGLIDRARREGFGTLSLSVSPENPAVRLYERFGFVRVPSRDDHWTMWLDLGTETHAH